jgi:FkbM family methyltransferase
VVLLLPDRVGYNHRNLRPINTMAISMILKSLYDRLPSSVQRAVDNERFRLGMPTMFGCISNLKRNGFVPNTIVDVGAYEGRWTRGITTIYPSVPVLMIEANPDKDGRLTAVQKRLGPTVSFERALLGATARKDVTFYSMETGSSVMPEVTSVPRTPITLDMQTLDDVTSRAAVAGPLLIKLDVQGYELEVLRGSKRTLQLTEVIVLELSLLEYNRGAPLLAQVLAEVSALGYAIYDICGQHRRQASGALLQMDAIFVRESSPLRTSERF